MHEEIEGSTEETIMPTPYDNAVGIIDVITEAWRQWVNRENELYTAWAEEQAEKSEMKI